MQLYTGSYTGNGADDRWINDPGFEPDLVIIRGDLAQRPVWRSSTMDAGDSATFTTQANTTNYIQAFGASGFQIGSDARVNSSGVTYYYVAIRDNGSNDFHVGTYTGNGADDRNITGVGFQPTVAVVKCDSTGGGAVMRTESHTGDDTSRLIASLNGSNRIQQFLADGFQVGSDAETNASGVTYHYFCFKDVTGYVENGNYTGNSIDDRDISIGFEPDFVLVVGDAYQFAVVAIDTMDAGDSALVDNSTPTTNMIQALQANGFQVGTSAAVNSSGVEYYWFALKEGTTEISMTAVSLAQSTTPDDATLTSTGSTPCFPGAMGFGSTTTAGWGGTVIKVTNRNDSGAGSLREALTTSGSRVVVFEVGGYITLSSDIVITDPFLTIVGETAPSPGICIRGAALNLKTHDVLVRHIRLRPGVSSGSVSAFNIIGKLDGSDDVYNIVVDHCSISWAVRINVNIWTTSSLLGNNHAPHDITFSNCIISESLYDAYDGRHQGFLVGDHHHNVSIIRCLHVHDESRCPGSKRNTKVEVINNYVHNAGTNALFWFNTTASGIDMFGTARGNVIKAGSNSLDNGKRISVYDIDHITATSEFYLDDNVAPLVPWINAPDGVLVDTPPVESDGLVVLDSSEVLDRVAMTAGAYPWDRDDVDYRIVNDAVEGTGELIDTEDDVGGYPTLANTSHSLTPPGNPDDVKAWALAYAEPAYRVGASHMIAGTNNLYLVAEWPDLAGDWDPKHINDFILRQNTMTKTKVLTAISDYDGREDTSAEADNRNVEVTLEDGLPAEMSGGTDMDKLAGEYQ